MAFNLDSASMRDAIVVLGAAGIVIPTFARFRITPVIGFILVGILAGPWGLGTLAGQMPWLDWLTISDPHAIDGFAEFGIILLLFSIGLELSVKRLWKMRKRIFGIGAAEMIGCAALITLVLWGTGLSGTGALGLGLALALSSTALVLPIAGYNTPVGNLAFSMLLFEDLALVPIIFLLAALAPHAADGWDVLLSTLGWGLVSMLGIFAFGHFIFPRLFAQAARTKSPELFLSASLLIVILCSLATAAAGLSPIVGALLAGLMIAETPYHGEVEAMTAPFRGLALGIFLISMGMSLNVDLLIAKWPLVTLAVLIVIAIKAIVTFALLRVARIRPGLAAETSVLMASPSETTLIVLAAAAQARLITADTAGFWQVVTAIGLTITPLLARAGRDLSRRIERQQAAAPSEKEATQERRTVLIGYGRVGQMVGEMLDVHSTPWIAIEDNIDTVTDARAEGKPVRYADAGRQQTLEHLELERADCVVLTMNQPVLSVRIAKWLREHHPNLTIVARARDPEHAAELYLAGVTDAVPETLESSLQLAESVLVDLGKAMGPVIASIHEKREELRKAIKEQANLDYSPALKSGG